MDKKQREPNWHWKLTALLPNEISSNRINLFKSIKAYLCVFEWTKILFVWLKNEIQYRVIRASKRTFFLFLFNAKVKYTTKRKNKRLCYRANGEVSKKNLSVFNTFDCFLAFFPTYSFPLHYFITFQPHFHVNYSNHLIIEENIVYAIILAFRGSFEVEATLVYLKLQKLAYEKS